MYIKSTGLFSLPIPNELKQHEVRWCNVAYFLKTKKYYYSSQKCSSNQTDTKQNGT
jgi:hypothetical protein